MKFESWKVFHIARKHLPPATLQKLFTRSSRLIYAWAANPKYCEVVERNPIDRIRVMLDELDNAGYGEYARAAIDYMAEPLGGKFSDAVTPTNDKDVEGELVDLMETAGNLAATVRFAIGDHVLTAAERIKVREGCRTVIREVQQIQAAVDQQACEEQT